MTVSTTTPATVAISAAASTWPDFQLEVATPGVYTATARPLRAVRAGYESYWETERSTADVRKENSRLVETVTLNIFANTPSTTMADFEAFRAQRQVSDPVVACGRTGASAMRVVQYTGDWNINRISCTDQAGGCSTVVVSLTKRGTWYDEDGNEVT